MPPQRTILFGVILATAVWIFFWAPSSTILQSPKGNYDDATVVRIPDKPTNSEIIDQCKDSAETPCISNGLPGRCFNGNCDNYPLRLEQEDLQAMGWETFTGASTFPKDDVPIVRMSVKERKELTPFLNRIMYWDRPEVSNTFKPIIKDRFLSTKIHRSGFNNRRMSLEVAYTLAFVTNRTLILQPPHPLVPFHLLGYEEKFWDIYGIKSGWPTLTYDEFKILPNYEQIKKDVLWLNWTSVPESVYITPSLPPKDSPEYQDYVTWRKPRDPEVPSWGQLIQEKDHTHFPHIYINQELFTQFYLFHFPTKASGITTDMILRLVRDHLHFRPEIFEYAARVLKQMPKCFSTMHFRRGDLDYPTGKIEPDTVFKNVKTLLFEEEIVYVATDDKPEEFKNSFIPVFEKKFKIISFQNYADLLSEVDTKWIPLIEMVICTQGRIFIGTHFSTMTAYIHRLRGYEPSTTNKKFYFTSKMYTHPDDHQDEPYLGWDREYARGFKPIADDIPLLESECESEANAKLDKEYKQQQQQQQPQQPKPVVVEKIHLSENWMHNIPGWENEINTQEIIQKIESRPKRDLAKFPAVSKFFDYFRFGPSHSWNTEVKTPFPELNQFLQMLRSNERNMFATATASQGYIESTSKSSFNLAARINVIWESSGKNSENSHMGVYAALGDVGYVEFKLNIDNEIVDFKWRGLKTPPNFKSYTEIHKETNKKDHKIFGKPTFYENCYFSGAHAVLDLGFYDNMWLNWWGFENGLSSADVTGCYSASIWTEEGHKHIMDSEAESCFDEDIKWLNDKSHSLLIDNSEKQACTTT